MKAITIKQPFATLIAEGLKEYEFRTWKTKYRGDILIHAGKGIDKAAMKRFAHLNLNYPLGCFVAKATITDCIEENDEMRKYLRKKDSWHGYGFKIENVEKIEPVLANGKLGLWEYEI